MCGGIGVEGAAATCLKDGHTFLRFIAQAAEEGVAKDIWPRKAVPQDQRCRDHEDQALRNPEDDEYFQEKTAHLSAPSFRVTSSYNKLISSSTDRLYGIVMDTVLAKLPPQAAHMHIQTAVEGIEFSPEHALY